MDILKLKVQDAFEDNSNLSLYPDGSATAQAFTQSKIVALEALTDAAIVDFDYTEILEVGDVTGLKAAYTADSSSDSNALFIFENASGVETKFKIPVMASQPAAFYEGLKTGIPSVITNMADEVLSIKQVRWSN